MQGSGSESRVIVSGAAGDIGAAAVAGFVQTGARIVALYHQSPPPRSLCDSAVWIQCDASNKAAVDAAFAEAERHLGGLDVLIQAAGTVRSSAAEVVFEDEIDLLFGANVKSTIFTNQAAFRLMKAHGGRIINFGSASGILGNPRTPIYAAAHGAVHSWTRSVAKGWGQYQITVNTIAPAMQTSLVAAGQADWTEEMKKAAAAALAQRVPIDGKLGDPARDLVPTLLFLASSGARFITGQIIPVDGGLCMVGA